MTKPSTPNSARRRQRLKGDRRLPLISHRGQIMLLLMLGFGLLLFSWQWYHLQQLAEMIPKRTAIELDNLLLPAATPTTPTTHSNPDNLQAPMAIGSSPQHNFLTTTSGCRMAKWVYTTATQKKRYRDCHVDASRAKTLLPHNLTEAAALLNGNKLQPYDTLYVTFQKLPVFVEHLLPVIKTDVIILTGQIYKTPPLEAAVVQKLLEHPHVVHWFCQNLDLHYQYGSNNNNAMHDHKVSPFPYGLKQTVHKHHNRDAEALEDYKQVFFQRLNGSLPLPQPNSSIYAGPLHPWPHRVAKNIPGVVVDNNHATTKLSPLEFYQQLAQHQFVLSPNGDRPECYRHYEALGLGVVPITELNNQYYSHLQGQVVYNTEDWDLNHLQEQLQNSEYNRAAALPNAVLEEFWMQYVEERVGRELQWGREFERS